MKPEHRELVSRTIGYLLEPLYRMKTRPAVPPDLIDKVSEMAHVALDIGAYKDFTTQVAAWVNELYPPR